MPEECRLVRFWSSRMPSATASFALAIVFLLGAHYVQGQQPMLMTVDTPSFPGMAVSPIFIGDRICHDQGSRIICQVENCQDFSAMDITFQWTYDGGTQNIALGDTVIWMRTDDLSTCQSTVTMGQFPLVTDVTCIATSTTSGLSMSLTSYIFADALDVQPTHFAFGFPELGIPSTNASENRAAMPGQETIVAIPFLGEMMRYNCVFDMNFHTSEQLDLFLELQQPKICLSVGGSVCAYYPGDLNSAIVGTSLETVMDIYYTLETGVQLTCIRDITLCTRTSIENFLIGIHDPARIRDLTFDVAGAVSVTGPDFQRMVGDTVTICCEYTGVHEVTTQWTDYDVNSGTFSITVPKPQTPARDLMEPDFGVTCITFEMTSDTQQDYTCCTSNDIGDPPGEKETIAVTLSGDPPESRMDEVLCLNPDGGVNSLPLECEPLIPPGADTYTYVWTGPSGPITVPDTQATIDVTEVGDYTCVVSNSIGSSSTSFQVGVAPLAEITVTITDSMGSVVDDRLVSGGTVPTYNLRVGDTIELTCENVRGDEIVEIFIPPNSQSTGNPTFEMMDITVQSFVPGEYSCSVTDPTNAACPASTDEVSLLLTGDPPVIPPPDIVVTPPVDGDTYIVGTDVCIPFGGGVILDCTVVSGTPVVRYQWTSSTSPGVISVERMLSVTMPGTYTCLATNDFGDDSAISTVVESPSVMLMASVQLVSDSCGRIDPLPADEICPMVGETVLITCNLQVPGSGELSIILPDGSIEAGGSLVLSGVTVSDNGDYTCRATNDPDLCTPSTDDITITIYGTPPILPPPEPPTTPPINGDIFVVGTDICIPLNGNAVLDCEEESGSPVVTYEWANDFNSDTSSDRLLPVDTPGDYTCIATNDFGMDTATSTVIESPGVAFSVQDSGGTVQCTALVGPVSFECVVNAGDSVILACSLDSNGGNGILSLVTPMGNAQSPDNHMIPNITLADAGLYICRADNNAGVCTPAEVQFRIDVIGDPPVIPPPNPPTDPPQNGDVFVPGTNICIPFNGRAILDCTAMSGTPVIMYQWTMDGSSTVISTEAMLEVTEPGSYTCLATNDFGTDDETSIVTESPSVMITAAVRGVSDSCSRLENPQSTIGVCPIVGDTLEITCSLDGTGGSGDLSMILPGGAVDPDGIVILSDVTVSDNGDYTCRATNEPDLCTPSEDSIMIIIDGFPPILPPPETPTIPPINGDIFVVGTPICIPLNGNAVLDCKEDSGSPVVTYQWTNNINSVTSSDRLLPVNTPGDYTCIATNDFGMDTATSTVIVSPNVVPSVDVISGGMTLTGACGTPVTVCDVSEGDMVTITCALDPAGGSGQLTLVTPSGDSHIGGSLTLSSIGLDEDGTYLCRAENDAAVCTPSQAPITIGVQGFPPVIRPPQMPPVPPDGETVDIGLDEICISRGSNVTLFCESPVGSQPINYFWLTGDSTSSNPTSRGQTLTVFDTGMYTCVANNSIGQDMASSTVIFPPQAMLTVSVTGGSRGTLTDTCSTLIEPLPPDSNVKHCPYVGEDIEVCCTSDIDGSTNVLTHLGQTPDADGKFRYVNAMIPDSVLIDGVYMCSAELVPGCRTEVTEVLELFDPAVINRRIDIPESTNGTNVVGIGRHPTPVPIPSGNDVEVYCPYSGLDDPTPQTGFFAIDSDGERVPSSELPMPKYTVVSPDSNTLVLIIMDYSPDDPYHTFECDTRNEAGEDTATITLQEDHVEWCSTPFGQCDMDCHLGVRNRTVFCCQRDTRLPVDEERCDELTKPSEIERCLEFGPCQLDPVWLPQSWSECSVTCGGGYRIRDIQCVIPGRDEVVPDSMCEGLPRPVFYEYCALESCCQADQYHSYCKLIATTSLCARREYQEICCWTCKTYFYN